MTHAGVLALAHRGCASQHWRKLPQPLDNPIKNNRFEHASQAYLRVVQQLRTA